MRLVVLKSLLVVTVLVVAVAWVLPASGCSRWLRRGGVGFTGPFLAGGSSLSARLGQFVSGDGAETAKLEQRVLELELELADLRAAGRERNELRALLELPQSLGWRYVFAPVVARDPAASALRFRIGAGNRQGVLTGAAVLAGGQVIGRVLEADGSSALVATVAATECRLSVTLEGGDVTGVLTGAPAADLFAEPTCIVDFLPRDGAYALGQGVLTSGLGDGMPKGFKVGEVIAWNEERAVEVVSRSYARLRVKPVQGLSTLHYVAVLVPVSAGYATER